jgi:hypothetical protein
MAVALADAGVAFYSADTWMKRFEVGSSLAISEVGAAGLVARYGPRAATGIGIIFSLVSAGGVHRQREEAVSAFLAGEFGDIDWGTLPSEDRIRLRREAWDLLFNTPPMSAEEFARLPRNEEGGSDIDAGTDSDYDRDVDVDGRRRFEIRR